ncbi:hypothetical protein PI172_0120 [Prevotella intermedia]|uniref:Uncharacterized protein n=1 Tax=Prevotella intermedia TaxID=28131 RepID=A0AAD1F665_PREIN|nr:hypothetical protein PIN17_A0644 [Prevotella intermedia 17]BAR94848.1 hypothetical protein PI172_0120 [Prevotella intermedia]
MHGKSIGFASQNSRFRNAKSKLLFSFGIIFTKSRGILKCDTTKNNIGKCDIINKESV